jgi:uncharacterized cupredoxin-like copper-binding protein
VGAGETNKEIGDELSLAEKIVKNYVSSIGATLEVWLGAPRRPPISSRHTQAPGTWFASRRSILRLMVPSRRGLTSLPATASPPYCPCSRSKRRGAMAVRRAHLRKGGIVTAVLVFSALALAGCQTTEATTIDVTLQEFSVIPAQDSALAGSITFNVENTGPDDVHEFVVLRTDLAPDALPTDENGAVTEEGEGIEVIDEIEDIPVGDTPSLTVDLDAGNYVLICNIWDEEEQEAHYTQGMRTAFTVE